MIRRTFGLRNGVARFAVVWSVVSASLLLATAGWSQTITWLGTPPGYTLSKAYGVSADGSVVVGGAMNAFRRWRAFRWVAAEGMQDLGTLPSRNSSAAYGVSADGSVVVGAAFDGDLWSPFRKRRAFRWVAAEGMQDLATLGGPESEAYGVSADGRVVVGWAHDAAGQPHAFRWEDGVMQDLATLGGPESEAYGVSADGRVVVGRALNAAGQWRAFRWTAAGGMEDLNITYASLLTDGSVLNYANAISPNGRYIVGFGYNAATGREEAFLLDTGFPLRGDVDRNGCVDDADLLAVLFAFGAQGYRNEDLNWDGTIDDADLLEVLFNFGSGC